MRKLLHLLVTVPTFAIAQAPAPPYPGAPAPTPPGSPAPAEPRRGGREIQPGQPGRPAAQLTKPTRPPQPTETATPGQAGRPAQPARGPAPVKAASNGEAERAGGDGKCTPLQGRFLLAFNKAEIVDVLEQASRWTCRNFAYTEDVARGKITLLSKTAVTAEEAYAAFLAALTSNNIAIYPSGRYYKLVRIADAKKTPIPTFLEGGAETPALEQPVTKLFRLHYADPDQLRGIMGNFTSPQGADIQSIPPDILIITDIGLNVRRIEQLLSALDKPGSGELIRFIQVRYASAKDLSEKVNQIFQANPTQPGRPGRRPVIGGVAPGVPGAPATTGGGDDFSLSKVMADERTNKLVVIADDKSFQRVKDLVEQLDLPTAGEGQIHVVFMKNATAEDLAQTLQALAQGQSSTRKQGGGGAPPGSPQQFQPQPAGQAAAPGATTAALFAGEVKITADKIANALIVLASGSDFASIQRLVEKLDRPRRQVFVEAVILEVNLNDETQFGVGAHTAIPFKTSDGTGAIPIGSEPGSPGLTSLNPLGLVSLGGFLTGLVGPTSAQLSDVLPGIPSIGVVVQALQSSSDVNVISTPHILATDNEDAEITVGQNVPFQAGFSTTPTNLSGLAGLGGTSSTSTSNVSSLLSSISSVAPIQRQNVELRLKIKPQITEGDNIRLQVDEQNEEISSKDAVLGPTTNKRTLKTNISVKDQSTIVIGGLIQERNIQSVKKVPFFGDIPVLGWLFRSTNNQKTKPNLLLFLTPYIIRDQSDYIRIYERKRKEQQDFLEQFYGEKSKYQVAIDYQRKTGPYTKMRKDVETETLKLDNGGPGGPGEGTVSPGSYGTPAGSDSGLETTPIAPPRPGAAPQGSTPAPASPTPGLPTAPPPWTPGTPRRPAPGSPGSAESPHVITPTPRERPPGPAPSGAPASEKEPDEAEAPGNP
ncbi:MAG: type II secretion system protein GspD [Anaeromyxobacter sp. RBG_16_69_14]|nr:MAG: type II secretion system protein GspD [Anaeromyxobacter sp. RBG_16_69_14]